MFTGLAGIFVAKLDESAETPKYTEGFQLGAGKTVSIVPQYAEGSVYGDNRRVKYKKKFKNANITLGVTSVPKTAEKTLFGREDPGVEGETISNGNDEANYVGFGCYATEEDENSDKPKYTAVWLYKVKFVDPGDEYETEGENIVFKTPSLTGSAEVLKNGDWRTKKQFPTETEAIAWLKGKAGISQ